MSLDLSWLNAPFHQKLAFPHSIPQVRSALDVLSSLALGICKFLDLVYPNDWLVNIRPLNCLTCLTD
ncbi:hypothetical protein TOL_1369 [Thalassolituus oleivorans MIL-1]|uniref:Uncharacterized protein n=1 Tax=Thalassolituus oleivorans MIL-1 TaxID=1298593 RepID=M5E2H3_9GAMM|nr:hypothetical protein TOL_1369 [Thalassolituus oleivorans MIL-1]